MNDTTNNTNVVNNEVETLVVKIVIDPSLVDMELNHSSIPYLVVPGVIAGSFTTYWNKEETEKIACMVMMIHSVGADILKEHYNAGGNKIDDRFVSAESIVNAIHAYARFEFKDETEEEIKGHISYAIEDVIRLLRANPN